MWAAWGVGAVLAFGCGEIREVPVSGSTSTGADDDAASTTGPSSTDEGTTPACGPDCDTMTGSSTSGATMSTTSGLDEERHDVCVSAGATIAAGDPGGGSATVIIEPGLVVADVDVLVRVFHERPRSIRVALGRDGAAPIDLLHNGRGDEPCRVDLAVRFDDEAALPASAYCDQPEDPAVVAPETPIADLLGDGAEGAWTLTASVPSSAAPDGVLADFCLSLALERE